MCPVLDDDSFGTVSSAFATWCLFLEVIVVEDKHDWHMVDNVGWNVLSTF